MKTFYKSSLNKLLIIFGIFICTVIVANLSLFDERLNPKITAINQANPQNSVDGNAYYAIMGITAVADKKIADAGRELLERYKQNRKNDDDSLNQNDYTEILGGDDKSWQNKYGDYLGCSKKHGCLIRLSEQLKSMPINDTRLTLMLQRYDSIIRMPNFSNFNDITVGTPMPEYGVFLKLSQLKLASLYNFELKSTFLSQIKTNFEFWKMLLVDSEMLLDKMVALRGIRNDLHYLSEYIQNNEISEQQFSFINSFLKPMTKAELDISESFTSESRTIFKWIDSIDSTTFNFDALLLQANASKNSYYKYFTEPLIKLSQLSVKDFVKELGHQESLQIESLLGFSPSSLYNYSGKALVTENFCNCWNYIARGHDFNNIINLVKLQLNLKKLGLEDIQQAVLNSKIINPYTDKAYNFDRNGNWLQFDCLETSSKCQVKL